MIMADNTSSWTVNGNIIYVSGVLDGCGADGIVAAMAAGDGFVLDFAGVGEIKFAALRALLRCRQAGKRFSIINAGTDVAERFEDSGVSSFITVTRRPKPLEIGKYDEFGAGFLSKAYNNGDGDSMIKVYNSRVPKQIVIQEKAVSRAVMLFGLPTPLVGSLYEDGEYMGIDFERIEGKRSFSRIISEEPGRLEEMTVRFARMCRKLHATQCDTNVFPDRTDFYRQAVMRCDAITDEEKARAMAFVDSLPVETTCLHGDMQLSNVITNGTDDLWIDLSDFGYGHHMLDMGMWYFLSMLNPEHLCQHIFHLSKAQMASVWDVFAGEYFDADTPDKKAGVIAEVEPYAALHMLYLGSNYGFEPGMLDFIRARLLS